MTLYNEIEPYAADWLRNLVASGHVAPGEVDLNATCHRWEYVQGMRDDPCECERCNPTEGLGNEGDEVR